MKKGDIIVTQGTVDRRYPDLYPYGIPIGSVLSASTSDIASYLTVQVTPFAQLRLARRGRGADLDEAPVNGVDGLKAAVLLFVAAILQVSIFSQVHVLGGVPDSLLVTLVAVSLLRGAIVGARRRLLRRPARRHGDARQRSG